MNNKDGQSMIELIVSMSIIVVSLLGVFAVLSQSLGLNKVAGNQYIAANLAAEGIEVTKNILDTNAINGSAWNQGFIDGDFSVQSDSTALGSLQSNPLLLNESTGIYGYLAGKETNFRRTINIENIDNDGDSFPDEIRVQSTVSWADRGGVIFNVNVEDRFRDWRI